MVVDGYPQISQITQIKRLKRQSGDFGINGPGLCNLRNLRTTVRRYASKTLDQAFLKFIGHQEKSQ